jgi:signal transduction histidine kinase
VAAERGLSLELAIPTGLPPVRADPARLRQVLTNLLDNAMKFTPAGGRVVVRGGRDPADAASVRVEVSDTGHGMPAEVLTRIFDRLYQVDAVTDSARRGLGLGLFLCKEIVERHGGRIWAESVPGSGSTFSFTLPASREVVAHGEA